MQRGKYPGLHADSNNAVPLTVPRRVVDRKALATLRFPKEKLRLRYLIESIRLRRTHVWTLPMESDENKDLEELARFLGRAENMSEHVMSGALVALVFAMETGSVPSRRYNFVSANQTIYDPAASVQNCFSPALSSARCCHPPRCNGLAAKVSASRLGSPSAIRRVHSNQSDSPGKN
jgi:hypothetical protein